MRWIMWIQRLQRSCFIDGRETRLAMASSATESEVALSPQRTSSATHQIE